MYNLILKKIFLLLMMMMINNHNLIYNNFINNYEEFAYKFNEIEFEINANSIKEQ